MSATPAIDRRERATTVDAAQPAGLYAPLGLREDPFPIEALAGKWVDLPSQRAPFTTIRDWLLSGETGLAVVSGAPGAGKTRLLDRLVHATIDAGERLVGVVPDDGARRSDAQLLRASIVALGGTPTGRTGLELTTELRAILATHRDDPAPPALFVDHAALTGSQLELVRAMLTTDEESARVQIVLFGPPVLPDRIARRRSLAGTLRQAVALSPLNLAETRTLLETRIAAVREPATDEPLFTPDAIELAWQTAQGVPGMTLQIAHRALREAIATGSDRVGVSLVATATAAVASGRGEPGAPNTDGAIQTRLTLPGLDDDVPRRRGRQR
jgi:type II secretory pathway predicted ATPase ExeA